MPKIIVTRPAEYADRLRKYKILVDGREAGLVEAGATIELDVDAGAHEVQARVDWCGSPRVAVEIGQDDAVAFEVRSALTGMRKLLVLYYILFARESYLALERFET